MQPIAIVRDVSPAINQCELTHVARQPIDVTKAQAQHRAYVAALRRYGYRVVELPPAPDLPDSVFVEDTAVVLPEAALITLPGAVSRRAERFVVAEALRPYRQLLFLQPPATLDGGDVLRLGRDIYVGLSTRSNRAALAQMQAMLQPWGYRIHGLEVSGCLHLKSAVTQIGERLLLLNPDWVQPHWFTGYDFIPVAAEEPYAANGVWLGEAVLYPTAYPRTQARLEAHGIRLDLVDVSELAKAEGAVTCCSLLFAA